MPGYVARRAKASTLKRMPCDKLKKRAKDLNRVIKNLKTKKAKKLFKPGAREKRLNVARTQSKLTIRILKSKCRI